MLKKILFAVLAVLAVIAAVLVWALYPVFFGPPGVITEEMSAEILSHPMFDVKNFDFDPASSFESRIKDPPGFMLEYLKKNDKAPDYKPYALTPEQRKTAAGCLESFPRQIRRVLKERLVGIYFIENFIGNGLSDLVLGPGEKRYAWIVINPAGFRKKVSEVFSERDSSVFRTGGIIKADCGPDAPGVLYALAHEGAHAVDFIWRISPYMNPHWYEVLKGERAPERFSWDVWDGYARPGKENDFIFRDKLSFYGLGGGARLDAADAAGLYAGLGKSPFVSLYGSQNWAEDFAERVVYGCLKTRLGRPCVIKYPDGEKTGDFVPGKAADARAMEIYENLSKTRGPDGK